MKFSGRFKSRLEANVGIGGCVSPQPNLSIGQRVKGRPGQHRRSVDPVEPVAVRLAGSQDYATKMGRVEICSVK